VGMFTYYLGSDNNWYVQKSDNYYKVEPIRWRVLTENYNSTNNALLLAESVLTTDIRWADSENNNYKESNIRKWLNGNSGTEESSDCSGSPGFLQTAFTTSAQALIADTTVDNGTTTSTVDNIFLLSKDEVTTSEYGFSTNYMAEDPTRRRYNTEYAGAPYSWWLRTPGTGGRALVVVCNEGNGVSVDGVIVHEVFNGIVPALCIPADQLP